MKYRNEKWVVGIVCQDGTQLSGIVYAAFPTAAMDFLALRNGKKFQAGNATTYKKYLAECERRNLTPQF